MLIISIWFFISKRPLSKVDISTPNFPILSFLRLRQKGLAAFPAKYSLLVVFEIDEASKSKVSAIFKAAV